MKIKLFLIPIACFLSLNVLAQRPDKAIEADNDWKPTGSWPFLLRKFEPATVVTGFFTKKTSNFVCNINISTQTLMYVQNDTLMEADPSNVNYVEFVNGGKYVSIGNVFAKIVKEDDCGRVLKVTLIDEKEFNLKNDATRMGSFTIGGDFGEWSIDLISAFDGNPEDRPLPTTDTYFFNFNKEIFEFTDKNVLQRIDPKRKKEYKVFTRSEEIISHNESSALKAWNTFFVNY